MLRSTITIDLPSAEVQNKTRSFKAWVRSLSGGALDADDDLELLTVEAPALLREIIAGFRAAGVRDVISLLVNSAVVYLDTAERDDDLEAMLDAADASRAFDDPFATMHVALSHRGDGLHTILDVEVVNAVRLGEAEMQITLSSRLEALRPTPGESADAFAARVHDLVSDPAPLRAALDAHDELTVRVAEQMREMISGGLVSAELARACLVLLDAPPTPDFGDAVSPPRYRPTPLAHPRQAHRDPYADFYQDDYFELACALILDRMLKTDAWRTPEVLVIKPDGALVCHGTEPEQADATGQRRSGEVMG